MFKKRQPIISNFYDNAYKTLVDKRFNAYNELELTIRNYFVKEAISHLFPANTESYTQAGEALKKAQKEVWIKKLNYIAALQEEQEYYNNNHMHFVTCKDYNNPNDYSVDLTIENIVRRVKGL